MQKSEEIKEYPKRLCGFFVKIRDDCYAGPFDFLHEARSEAKDKGSNMEIYHGILIYISEHVIDANGLCLLPNV
jgi:hypothetical protein